MKPIINFEECLRDSPKFRSALEESEENIEQLEQKLEKLVKQCTSMVESGKAYLNTKSQFIYGLNDLVTYFKDDIMIVNALNKLSQALGEMLKYQSILIDQAHRSIYKNLDNFVKNDIRQVKDTKKYFERISEDLDQSLNRNSQVPRNKPHECDEISNVLTAVRSCFQHTALDYVCQISLLQAKKKYEVLDTLLNFMNANSTFFHQGSDLCEDLDPFLKDLSSNLEKMREETADLDKQMDGRHTLVTTKEIMPKIERKGSGSSIYLDGYLFKRTSNAFKTWNRRWFIIHNNQLVYRKRNKDDTLTTMEEDLRLCTVKPANDVDRRFCFEVLSPTKSHMLQADSEEMYNTWLNSLQAGINAAIQETTHEETEKNESSESLSEGEKSDSNTNFEVHKTATIPSIGLFLINRAKLWQQIVNIPGNDKCCDCQSLNPRWASINLGITLCIECSGIHRSLGVHYSKVRSLTLDAWEAELGKIMTSLGNTFINKIFEAGVNESIAKRATPDCSRDIREAWIKAKYIQKAFIKIPLLRSARGSSASLDDLLISCREKVSPPDSCMSRKRSAVLFDELHTFKDLVESSNLQSIATKEDTVDVLEDDESCVVSSCLEMKSDNLSTTSEKEEENAVYHFKNRDSELEIKEEIINANQLLHRAALSQNIPSMCEALAYGADLNWSNPDDEGKYAIHQAIISGSVIACEYLFLNGAKINSKDIFGRTPLHLATELGNTGQVCTLLKRGADQHSLDTNLQDALSIAVKNANADIVTLLRLGRLNEQMKESEFGSHDETFNEVVKDFSKLASDNPEKLKRLTSSYDE